MLINELDPRKQFLPLVQQRTQNLTPEGESTKFVDSLNELISDTDKFQKEEGMMTAKLIKGEPVDIHDVMISAEKAKTSFSLLLEMRNKFLDMYREVSRIQV